MKARLGTKLRGLRRRKGLKQTEVASRLGISPSYLNLIEHDQRQLQANLLLKAAEVLGVELAAFTDDSQGRLAGDLQEVFGDPLFEEHPLTTADLREIADNPPAARAVIALYHAYRASVESTRALASKLYDGQAFTGVDPAHMPSEEVSDVIQLNPNYFAAALLMPYDEFLRLCDETRYDIELLQHHFTTSWEQVCHRLTTLRKPGANGVPFHFVRVDIAGNISKRYSGTGIRFARFSGSCPRWDVHAAFLTPGRIRTQLSKMPDGTAYFCVARTIRKSGGYRSGDTLMAVGIGCPVRDAKQLVYADGIDLENLDAAVPIGTTCRMCERVDCDQRAFPALQFGMTIDENVRGRSFFAPR